MAELYDKLDARSRRRLAAGIQTGRIEIFLRLSVPPTPEQRVALEEAGCQIRSTAGTILTASVSVEHLPLLAVLPFILNIQLSRPLFDEKI